MIYVYIRNAVFYSLLLTLLPGSLLANTFDPLNSAEMSQAAQMVTPPTVLIQGRQLSSQSSQRSTRPRELELLLIERRPTGKQVTTQRLADVFQYDYNTDETIHSVIDLSSQHIVRSSRQQRLQLPLTNNELARTTQLLFEDSEQMQLMRDEYQRITGRYLAGPNQLNIKAFNFTSDTLPERLNQASAQCGLNRCAQVLLYTHDSIVFEISPIVNLSAGLVTQNIGF